jgi:hypothetical protein
LKRFAGFTIKTRSKHSDLRKIDSPSAQILEKLNQVTQHWDVGTVPILLGPISASSSKN